MLTRSSNVANLHIIYNIVISFKAELVQGSISLTKFLLFLSTFSHLFDAQKFSELPTAKSFFFG